MPDHCATIARLQITIEELQQRETVYHSLYVARSEGIAIYEIITDAADTPVDYRIVDVNPAFEAITELSRSDIIGRRITELYGTDEPPYLTIYAHVAATGEPHSFETTIASLQKTFRITVFSPAPGKFATIFCDIVTQNHSVAALRESETRYRKIAELMSDYAYAFQIETNGRVTRQWVTDAFRWITGFSAEEVITIEGIDKLVYPEDLTITAQRKQRLLDGYTDVSEFRIVTRSGDIRWLRDHAYPVWDKDQARVVHIYGVAQDITERKCIEATLQQQALVQTFMDNSPTLIFARDLQGRFLFANHAYEATVQLPAAEIIGKTPFDILPPTVAHAFLQHDQATITTARSLTKKFRWGIQDELHDYLVTTFPLYDTQNQIYAVGGIAVDITDYKETEETLNLFKHLVEHAMDGVVLMHLDSTIHYANAAAARLFGTTPEQLVGMDGTQFSAPEEQHRIKQEVVPALRKYNHWQGEFRSQRLDGTSWRSQTSTVALRDTQGNPRYAASIFRDVTHQRHMEEQLQFTQFALDHALDGVAFVNQDGHYLYVNHALCHTLGYTQDELLALRIMDINPMITLAAWHEIWNNIRQQGANIFEGVHYRKDGSSFPVEITSTYLEFAGKAYICAFTRNITERKAYQQQIERLAFTDPLTGLANRRRLYVVGEAALTAAIYQPDSIALLYLDLDRFKAFNDTLGHDAGDDLLIQVTQRLQRSVHEAGLLARIGGDEFAVLLTDTDDTQATALAHHILEQLNQPFYLHNHYVYLSGSIGIVCGTTVGQPFSTLLTRADIAMYRAKLTNTGVQVYDPISNALAINQVQFEAELRQTLQVGMLTLYYQPILDLTTWQLFGVEALVRWSHPTRGLLSPSSFLPMAAEAGLLKELDTWVIEAALTQAAAWHASGYPLAVSVNLSAPSLQQANLVEWIVMLLSTTGVPAEYLVVELTEQTALHDLPLIYQVLAELQAMGVRIALDDFGTGYASLSHLRELPIDILKVEHAFAAGIGHNLKDEAVLRAVLTLGAGLEMMVVAEGVEENTQLAWLREAGCRHIQGFLIGCPMPPEQLNGIWKLH